MNKAMDNIEALAHQWINAGGDSKEKRGFSTVWVEQSTFWALLGRDRYRLGAHISGGGLEPADDPNRVDFDAIKQLCAHLRAQGHDVLPSRKIRKYFSLCGTPG
jgi:hypothetical protein